MKNISKKQIDNQFKAYILPSIVKMYEQDRRKDKPARREAYNNYIDSLQKDGQITESKGSIYCIPSNLL